MKCSKYKKLLLRYYERDTRQEMPEDLKEHLSYCRSCRQKAEQSQRMTAILNKARREKLPDAPQDFNQNVMRYIHHANKKRVLGFNLRQGMTIATCILILGLAIFVGVDFLQDKNIEVVMQDDIKLEHNFTDNKDLLHAKSEVVELLTQAIEIIKKGDQEWEIEI